MNYRGIKPAEIITVLEGEGTRESPYTVVQYVVSYQQVSGFDRMYTVGKIVELTEKEKESFGDLLPPQK